jgi:hypothetical protein
MNENSRIKVIKILNIFITTYYEFHERKYYYMYINVTIFEHSLLIMNGSIQLRNVLHFLKSCDDLSICHMKNTRARYIAIE